MQYKKPDYDVTQWHDVQNFQRIDKYSNYLWDQNRVETWNEVVARSVNTLKYIAESNNVEIEEEKYQRMYELIYTLEIMPSMRLLSMPFEAVKRCNTVLYNCSFGLCDRKNIFAEALYLGMSGCGVAFSVERKNINKLPVVTPQTGGIDSLIVEDSQVGWAKSVQQLTNALYSGYDIIFDYSKLRPSGVPLRTKGGYASGPQPLINIHNAMRRIFGQSEHRRLQSIEVYDLMCWMLEGGISGATRRSAGLSLFDADDEEMMNAKYNGFWNHPEDKVRANANNSLVWEGVINEDDILQLTSPWVEGTGEPGLFKRDNAIRTSPEWRTFPDEEYVGVNSCAEIILAPSPVNGSIPGGGWQFCNLTSINANENDTINTLEEKALYATIIGDIQSLATDFQFLSNGTKKVCDRDRLLGVNLVGYAQAPILRDTRLMTHLQHICELTDVLFSDIHQKVRSAAITAVKPSGNSSVLTYSSPGMNVIHGKHQIRNVTVNKNSAMHRFLESQGVPRYDYPGRDYASMFSFPMNFNDKSLTLENTNAIEQLEIWREHKFYWCHHNPSCSITFEPDEIEYIKEWLLENQDIINALAFFPKFDASYELLPISVVTEQRYKEFVETFPDIDWSKYEFFETDHDDRQLVVECGGGVCEIQY